MERKHIKTSEVIAFLEDMISIGMATEDEQTLYENFRWNGKLEKNYTYKKLIRKMSKFYNEEF